MFAHILLASLPLFAAASPLQPRADCGSIHPKWTLEDINLSSYYTYTSPSALGPRLGTVSFTFENDQVDYTASCKGNSVNPQGTFYSSQTFDCETPDGTSWKKTSFDFDTSSSVFNVNSIWTCGGDVVYQISGSGKADLKCETITWTNDDWQSGELYSNTTTVCEPATLVIQL
ncbi:hypothetical protein K469DRAFT_571726 [Zopfia rhizophila CBS 207.26]|uniref:AA1-like domain-containing protein n=1 Tax=Zopfia rhizophila CBS 207.26 TaxID=1314779 RepID=A0A6A6E474_9PEZI|nr:hypothetical protein K469DRAFT_571726 [Zopfia rhizophila CBS 207.26]